MDKIEDWMQAPARDVRVVAKTDVVVVGGGPAGLSAALAAARSGASVVLLERYNHLGGLASGGMVLVLDDMWDNHRREISVRGTCMTMIERMAALDLAVYPREDEWGEDPASVARWSRWGTIDLYSHRTPRPICFAAAFDPDGWKRVALELVGELGITLRLHSWFSQTLVEGNVARGVVCETKSGREAILADVVIDATGDLDVAASAGAQHIRGSYMMTTVFRLGGVDTDAAERFEREDPDAFDAVDKQIKKIFGGSWSEWWLKTPLPGVVWCNCPHIAGHDGLVVSDLTAIDVEGRRRISAAVAFARGNLPGFERCYVVDVAPQTGVRQTRLLEGEYVLTKEDIAARTRFADSVARGRDYYMPYRVLVPREIDNLLVAGRHYSATSLAQRISREIPPCMAMGDAAGVAAAVALDQGVRVRDVDVRTVQRKLREYGADPGGEIAVAEAAR
ncbi:MAG TPA: FAD-dependent oxidoreductase [Candidatus Limnocylindria bacterium]|nr:FAD-dependent oxidoreductase [Candidatus Limnocylindria bacterium]